MPLYEYRCQGCGRVVEILQRMGDTGTGLTCPGCGSSALERAFSSFARAGGAGAAACAPGPFT